MYGYQPLLASLVGAPGEGVRQLLPEKKSAAPTNGDSYIFPVVDA